MLHLLRTFFSALAWYAVLTLPALFLPPMYFMSLLFTLKVCWIAGLLFIIMAYLVKHLSIGIKLKMYILYVIALLSVWTAFLSVEVFGLWKNLWQDIPLLLFPFSALLSAWFSIYGTRDYLAIFFNKVKDNENIVVIQTQHTASEV